jgi:hypothetical protein
VVCVVSRLAVSVLGDDDVYFVESNACRAADLKIAHQQRLPRLALTKRLLRSARSRTQARFVICLGGATVALIILSDIRRLHQRILLRS